MTFILRFVAKQRFSLTVDCYTRQCDGLHIFGYINQIQCLFPNYKLHPNHHLALHIAEFLLLFGPVHSWWAFPFKCLIGNLQRMPNKGKTSNLVSLEKYGSH